MKVHYGSTAKREATGDLKVAELKYWLTSKGKSTKGKKDDLVERYVYHHAFRYLIAELRVKAYIAFGENAQSSTGSACPSPVHMHGLFAQIDFP